MIGNYEEIFTTKSTKDTKIEKAVDYELRTRESLSFHPFVSFVLLVVSHSGRAALWIGSWFVLSRRKLRKSVLSCWRAAGTV